jgi:flagellar biosynthesis anti-sigma factor FlgM
MKIDVQSPSVSQLPVDHSTKKLSNNGPAGIQSATEDRTTFQSDSAAVKDLTSQALNSPEVRQDQVNALRQSVNSGEYSVNATKIAAAIIEAEGK